MAIAFYRCSICDREYSNAEEADKCEFNHCAIEDQINLIAESVAKLYEMGGKIEMTIGSNDKNDLDCIGINIEKNTLLLKNWTSSNYVNSLFNVRG